MDTASSSTPRTSSEPIRSSGSQHSPSASASASALDLNGSSNHTPTASPKASTSNGILSTPKSSDVSSNVAAPAAAVSSSSREAELEAALKEMTDQKSVLETQYRSLLGKLTNMRNTLGDKLKQDAVRPPLPPLCTLQC